MSAVYSLGQDGPLAQDSPSSELPLYVDLDGTLLRTDLLAEDLLSALLQPAVWLALPGWFLKGKAHLKARLAERMPFDPAILPYNEDVLAYLREEHARGRRLVLATAADRSRALAISDHLGLFDDVIASDGANNLKGGRKLQAILEHCGGQPFAYAGNDVSDLEIWRAAARSIVVTRSAALVGEAAKAGAVEAAFTSHPPLVKAVLKALRPYQWCKNLLVFVPPVTAGAVSTLADWMSGGLLFLSFCATASAIYVFNDLSDLAADRKHPRKRRRPFASGAIPVEHGVFLGGAMLASGIGLAMAAHALPLVACYAVVSLAYSARLKEFPLVDVFALAFLYCIRLFAGGVATNHPVSLWLLGFASFLFLSLAFIKRVSELQVADANGSSQLARRGYSFGDLTMLKLMGVAATFTSSLVLALYVQSTVAAATYANPAMIWPMVPLLLFWQCRLWLSTQRGYMHDDPIVYSAGDWVSWAVACGLGGMMLLAHVPTLPLL